MGFQNMFRSAAAAATFVFAVAGPRMVRAQAVLRGFIYDDASGGRLNGGTVMLVDPVTDAPVVHVSADSLGQFILRGPAGHYQIAAVHAGYTSVLSAPIAFEDGESMTIRVPLATTGDPTHNIGVLEHTKTDIAPKRVATGREWTDGFRMRKTLGMGVRFDRNELAHSRAVTVGDLLRRVPGVAIGSDNSTASVAMRRTGMAGLRATSIGTPCQVGWFVDGRRIDRPGDTDPVTASLASMHLDELEALEVFRGLSEMPAEFADPDLQCGAVALWTRR